MSTTTLGTSRSNDTTYEKMAGHWLLAKLGKKVLRPGGIVLTRWMLSHLKINNQDEVVEIAPGMGATAREVLSHSPKHYTALDADQAAIEKLEKALQGKEREFIFGQADEMSLKDQSATVLLGEAFLTMQTEGAKKKMLSEISRVLKVGGRYGMHELCITTKNSQVAEQIKKDLSKAIRVNANPLTVEEWAELLESVGLTVEYQRVRPMELLKVKRMIEDEGMRGMAKIMMNLVKNPKAAKRVFQMRKIFDRYEDQMGAISMVATKKA